MEDSLLLRGLFPCRDFCSSSWVGWSDEGGAGDTIIFLGRKYENELAFLASDKGTLNGCCVCRHKLMYLLDVGAIWLARILGQ